MLALPEQVPVKLYALRFPFPVLVSGLEAGLLLICRMLSPPQTPITHS